MAILQNSIVASAPAGGDVVTRSLRFSGDASLQRTPSTAGDNNTWTVAFWIKRGELGSIQNILHAYDGSSSNRMNLRITANDVLDFYSGGSVGDYCAWDGTRKLRDVGAFYHICVVMDATQSTATNRMKVWINGEPETLNSKSGYNFYPAQNASSLNWNNGAYEHEIGDQGGSFYVKLYLADFYHLDGTAVSTPVGNFLSDNGWGGYKPKSYTGSFGTNGFHIKAQQGHDADLLISSVARNDGDTLFADAAKGHPITGSGAVHKNTVGNPFDSGGTAMYFDGSNDWVQVSTASSDFQFGTGDFTIEGWYYFTHLNSAQVICDLRPSNVADSTRPSFNTTGANINMHFNNSNTTVGTGGLTTSQWQHIAIIRASGSLKVYVDGSLKGTTTFTSNLSTSAIPHIGATNTPNQEAFLSGYVYDFRITKGTAVYTGSSFTVPSATFEVDPVYIGADQSGNKNHWTATNLASSDVVLSTPTNNYATWDAVQKDGGSILSEGNLKTSSVASNNYHPVQATMNLPSGTGWYAEFYVVSNDGVHSPIIGIQDASRNSSTLENIYVTKGVALRRDGVILRDNSSVRTGLGATSNGDIIMVAYKDRKIWFGRNGTWFHSGDPANDSNESTTANTEISGYHFAINAFVNGQTIANFGADPTFANNKTSGQDTSQSEFYYAPPTGFKSLCTSNLDDPTVKPNEHFGVVTYSGTGSATTVSTDFQPNLVWVKRRNSSSNHVLTDSVRGANKALSSNTTGTEDSSTSLITAFNATSFGVGTDSKVNASGGTYVGWHLKESANAGFDIVTYEGDSDTSGDTQSISHSLGVAPEMIIVKARDGRAANDYYARDYWYVWHKDLTSGSSLYLNDTSAAVDYSSGYTSAPISSVGSSTFTVCNAEEYNNYYYDFLNWGDPYGYYTGSNERYVAYLFSSVEGVSKVGSYTGNGSADGPFVYTGFRPAFVMVKPIETSYSWYIHDTARNPYNYSDLELTANSSGAEYSVSGAGGGYRLDILSTGFKHRTSNVAMNQSGYKYAFLAISESPLKYANGK